MNEKNFVQKDCTSTEPPKSSHDRTFKGLRDFAEDVSVVSAKTTMINKNGFRMMALNIFSLMPHLDELRISVRENNLISYASLRPKLIASLKLRIT